MIIIKSGDKQIYNPKNPNLKLINPKLILEDNAAGSLTFKIYESNLNYAAIRKLYPVVTVIRNEKTIFKGRVIADEKDFYNGKNIDIEGKLAFFNDSYLEPFSFSGSPEELFRMLIENHNSQVKDWQRFKVGIVTVEDSNDYIVRSSENVINTWEALKSRCFQSSLGGHIRIRYEKDGDYIDWLSDYEAISLQSIEFAKNMMDLSLTVDASETYTAIRPIGAEVDGIKIDISSVNGGKTYLINEEKAEEYGVIYAPSSESTWEDVTLPKNLLKKAEEKLYGTFTMLNESYEIKAIDLNLTDESIEALNICEYVLVRSRMHDIEERYLLNKAEVFIAEPQNSIYHLGVVKRTFDDANSGKTVSQAADIPKDVSAFRNDAGYVSKEQTEELLTGYTKETDVEAIVIRHIENIPSGKDGEDGYSPTIDITPIENGDGWIILVTDKNGEKSFTIMNGKNGADGKDGQDGISPAIVENENNTDDVYKLDIVSASGTFTTPNLKGAKGDAGGSGSNIEEPVAPSEEEEVKQLIKITEDAPVFVKFNYTLDFDFEPVEANLVNKLAINKFEVAYNNNSNTGAIYASTFIVYLRYINASDAEKTFVLTSGRTTTSDGKYSLGAISDALNNKEFTVNDLASKVGEDIGKLLGIRIQKTGIGNTNGLQEIFLDINCEYYFTQKA